MKNKVCAFRLRFQSQGFQGFEYPNKVPRYPYNERERNSSGITSTCMSSYLEHP